MATEEQTDLNGGGFTAVRSGYSRQGQRLTISNREVTKLGFWINKVGAPTGDVYFRIRKVSTDAVLLEKLWGDAGDLIAEAPAYREVTFDTPATINEEVRIACEFSGGGAGVYVSINQSGSDVKADEVKTTYTTSWSDDATKDLLYIYTYTGISPTVTTQAVTAIAGTTATGNGNLTATGTPTPTQHGHCWNTTGTPDTDDSKTENGAKATTGAFTSAITGLTAGTKYYVRAYATNAEGTSYGNQVEFVADKGTVFPSDDVARVSSIRHIFRPGFFRMQAGLGDLGFDIDVAETAVRRELDTVKDSFKERMETTAKQLQEEAGMSREESLRIARKLETLEDIAREPIGPIPTPAPTREEFWSAYPGVPYPYGERKAPPTAPPPRFPAYEAQIEYEVWFEQQLKELREMGWEG